jgi:hypothetical protein
LLCVRCRLDLDCQERATEGQPFRSMAIGEESEVSNAMEAVGQGVEQEAPDELVRLQTHGLYGAVVAIILPGEPGMFVVAGLDAAVGDGDAMGVAAEMASSHLTSKGGLAAGSRSAKVLESLDPALTERRVMTSKNGSCDNAGERSRKPKYDFQNLDSQRMFRRAVMPDERRRPRQKDRSCQRFQLFPSSTMMRLFVRRPASF